MGKKKDAVASLGRSLINKEKKKKAAHLSDVNWFFKINNLHLHFCLSFRDTQKKIKLIGRNLI